MRAAKAPKISMSESYEEINGSADSEEADPWGMLINEAASELRKKL